MTTKNYYLGVDSVDTAYDAVNTLSFCTVLDRNRGEIQIVDADRINVMIGPDEDSGFVEGAIISVFGTFTPGEMREIESLVKYEYRPLRQKVARFAAQIGAMFRSQGVSAIHHILGTTE